VRSRVVGTAGHVDHGKTALVRALTGKDTDRLPEEKQRGISIDLGYAPLDLPGGRRLSVVDVPGHERFVSTMVAGATGIDLFLLVVDAAEGPMPQTREHLAILRLLGVRDGVVAVTKADTVDEDELALVCAEAGELVPGAPVVRTSATTGDGLDDLRSALTTVADRVEPVHGDGPTRLFVDRVFSLHGVGTVCTGTLWSGRIAPGDELVVKPSARPVRVRSVQVHDEERDAGLPGHRVAVALAGVARTALRRGDALVAPRAYEDSYRLDVALELFEPVADGARVHVHHGTAEIAATVRRLDERFAQLRLQTAAVAARGDRVILRTGETVGGAIVLDPAPPHRTSAARLRALEEGALAAVVHAPVRAETLERLGQDDRANLDQAGEWVFSPAWLAELKERLDGEIHAASPLDPGVPAPTEPWSSAIVPLLGFERRGTKLYRPGATGTLAGREDDATQLEARLGLEPVRVEDAALARFLEDAGRLVRVGDGLAISPEAYASARETLVEECEQAGSITLGRFRDLLGSSRRTSELLLDRFDRDGITRRLGDARVLRRAARATR
jgi:selenocysteine-specific elongation factor